MEKVRLSKKFTLAGSDWLRALFMAVLTAVITVLQQSLEAGNLDLNWKALGNAALAAALSYLVKNFAFEPPKVIATTTTNTKAENLTDKVKDVV